MDIDTEIDVIMSAAMSKVALIFDKYCEGNPQLRTLLQTHCSNVARLALRTGIEAGLEFDKTFTAEAALLHDIGVVQCSAPGIHCHGPLPYICHGVAGRTMLEKEGMPRHALVCERHTGAGITIQEIEQQRLPLPRRQMLPMSVEEKLVCYADKFYSKSGDPDRRKPLASVKAGLARYGSGTINRFAALCEMFTPESGNNDNNSQSQKP